MGVAKNHVGKVEGGSRCLLGVGKADGDSGDGGLVVYRIGQVFAYRSGFQTTVQKLPLEVGEVGPKMSVGAGLLFNGVDPGVVGQRVERTIDRPGVHISPSHHIKHVGESALE